LHAFAGFETAKKTQRNGEKNQEPKIRKLKREKKWIRQKFQQPVIIVAVSDFEQ